MDKDTRKDAFIGFDCPSALKERARRAAARDGRTLSGWVRHVLRRHLAIRRQIREGEEKTDELETA